MSFLAGKNKLQKQHCYDRSFKLHSVYSLLVCGRGVSKLCVIQFPNSKYISL